MYIDYVQQLLIINTKNQTDTMHLDIRVYTAKTEV